MRRDLMLIVSVDRNWGIGKENDMLKPIPEDLKRFAKLTKRNLIIIGRKTLETFPNKKPLSDRINVVLTRDEDYYCEGAVIVHDLDGLFAAIRDHTGPIYVCGGESVYRQLLPYCSKAYITRIDEAYDADKFVTNLDESPDWVLTSQGEWQESKAGVLFRYDEFERTR